MFANVMVRTFFVNISLHWKYYKIYSCESNVTWKEFLLFTEEEPHLLVNPIIME